MYTKILEVNPMYMYILEVNDHVYINILDESHYS